MSENKKKKKKNTSILDLLTAKRKMQKERKYII